MQALPGPILWHGNIVLQAAHQISWRPCRRRRRCRPRSGRRTAQPGDEQHQRGVFYQGPQHSRSFRVVSLGASRWIAAAGPRHKCRRLRDCARQVLRRLRPRRDAGKTVVSGNTARAAWLSRRTVKRQEDPPPSPGRRSSSRRRGGSRSRTSSCPAVHGRRAFRCPGHSAARESRRAFRFRRAAGVVWSGWELEASVGAAGRQGAGKPAARGAHCLLKCEKLHNSRFHLHVLLAGIGAAVARLWEGRDVSNGVDI